MLYELRKYEVMPGKLPALLDRFGSFVADRWNDYGINLVAFWTPDFGGMNNQVIYIWGWESFEERQTKLPKWQESAERKQKWAETEKDGPLVRRVNNVLLEPTSFSPIDHGISYDDGQPGRAPYVFELREYDAVPGKLNALVNRFGSFTTNSFKSHGFRQVGFWTPLIGAHNNRLVYILAWKDFEERHKKFAEFRADPERQRFFAESEKGGPLVEQVVNQMMAPTAFSPMK
jgi:hypothetical protein